jgi:hypothetical protein
MIITAFIIIKHQFTDLPRLPSHQRPQRIPPTPKHSRKYQDYFGHEEPRGLQGLGTMMVV